ncbi:hypothetical protein RJ640_028507 [Escallonia rubra]|uniref:CCHC-type domain-containing protein n=1 Tax=Escallonia rubra TaxID=112253 RepID=A0AA88QBN8_9ASTE|nr:hypothetical protein RJ640_028507 [Escallonia rubra]
MFRRISTNQSHQRNNSDWNVKENPDACYECGRTGHIKKYCPQLRNKTASSNSRDFKEKKLKSRKALLTWDDSDESDKEGSEDEDVAQLCFITNDDDPKVTPEKHFNELKSAFLELNKNYEKLKTKNSNLKIKALSLISTVEELEGEKEELQEKVELDISENVSLENNLNASKKENSLLSSKIQSLRRVKVPVENEYLKSQLEDISTQKVNLEKEIEDLNFTLSKFTQGRENLDILLGKQRCVFEKSGIGYDPSKKQKDYKIFFNKSLASCSPFTLCTFEGDQCLISHASDGGTLVSKRDGNIYTLSFDASDSSREVCLSVQHNDSWLWHRRLGHVHMDLIKKLLSKDLVRGLPNLRFGLDNAKPRGTPISPSVNLIKDENGKDVDSKLFRGLWYPRNSSLDLVGFSDSDYAGCLVNRKSTSGTYQFLGDALVSWHSKKQTSVALSTAEAEYVAAGSCCAQVL